MAAEGKKSVTVTQALFPFMEAQGKKMPAWLDAIPNIGKDLGPVVINRKMELDMRKWKVADIQSGIYAIARYELKIFATHAAKVEKNVMSAIPKEKLKNANWAKLGKEFYADRKSPERDALEKAKKSLTDTWKSIAQEIENKVSVALDEVESDTGDNKKALASAKEAFKKFDRVDPVKMLGQPTNDLISALKKYSDAVPVEKGQKPDKDKMKEVEKLVASVEGTFNANTKKMLEVVKYFLDAGKSMSKDEKANAVFQDLGKEIIKESKSLKGLEDALQKFEDELTSVKNLIKKEDVKKGEISSKIGQLETAKSKQGALSVQAIASVNKIRELFKKAKTEVKA